MGLDKAIEHGKEKRKPYRGAKAVDCTCRNHGSCDYCRSKRMFFNTKKKVAWNDKLREWKENEGMRVINYTFYGEDGYPVTDKEIMVSDMALPQELDEYGYEELSKLQADYLPVTNFTYEERD